MGYRLPAIGYSPPFSNASGVHLPDVRQPDSPPYGYRLSYQCADMGRQTEPPPNGQPPTERASSLIGHDGCEMVGGGGGDVYDFQGNCNCICVVQRGQLQLLHVEKQIFCLNLTR